MQIIGMVEEANSTSFTFWMQEPVPIGSMVQTHCLSREKAFGVVVSPRIEKSELARNAIADPHMSENAMEGLKKYLGCLMEARIIGRLAIGKVDYKLPRLPAEKGQDVFVCEEAEIQIFLDSDSNSRMTWVRHLLTEPVEIISAAVVSIAAVLSENERRAFILRAGYRITGSTSWSFQKLETLNRCLGAVI